MGIFPQALINYITTGGGGFNWTDSREEISHSMEELIKLFDLGKMGTAASRLQASEIDNCNRLEIQRHIKDPALCTDLVHRVRDFITKSKPNE